MGRLGGGNRARVWAMTLLVSTVALAGCAGGGSSPTGAGDEALDWTPGVHPYPTGDEWPADLVNATFELAELREERIPSFDGVELETWVLLPDVPDGVQVPVVLWSSPYFGQTYAPGNNPSLWDNSGAAEAVPVNLLVEHGYAVAIMNLRGSGQSGGCYDLFGHEDWKDNAAAVEWLARQSWSNGRVGMMGLSYHGTTPWMAAVEQAPALKTIVVAGMVHDLYGFAYTPQGAPLTVGSAFLDAVTVVDTMPPATSDPLVTAEHYPFVASERACPEVAQILAELPASQYSDRRDAGFWAERRLITHFPDVTTSVFLTHGFQDLYNSGHAFAEDAVWGTLEQAPARAMIGQWGHEFPNFGGVDDFNEQAVEWLDFWLKGIGDEPPGLGVVEYEDGAEGWHNSTAWPPAEARDEVLYLADGGLSAEPASSSLAFRSVPHPNGAVGAACQNPPAGEPTGLVFATQPAADDVFVAGNPHAYLRITSDLPGGLVGLDLYEIPGDVSCSQGTLDDTYLWSFGAADLRFHQGNMGGQDFPVDEPTHVRVDMTNLAEVLEAGNRLVLVVSYGDAIHHSVNPAWSPTITLVGAGDEQASHLVFPVVDGTFGGAAPTLDYPPRPFVPTR